MPYQPTTLFLGRGQGVHVISEISSLSDPVQRPAAGCARDGQRRSHPRTARILPGLLTRPLGWEGKISLFNFLSLSLILSFGPQVTQAGERTRDQLQRQLRLAATTSFEQIDPQMQSEILAVLHARMPGSGGQTALLQQLQVELLQERQLHQAARAEVQQLQQEVLRWKQHQQQWQQWQQQFQQYQQRQQQMITQQHDLLQWPASFDEQQIPPVLEDGSPAAFPSLEAPGYSLSFFHTPDNSLLG